MVKCDKVDLLIFWLIDRKIIGNSVEQSNRDSDVRVVYGLKMIENFDASSSVNLGL